MRPHCWRYRALQYPRRNLSASALAVPHNAAYVQFYAAETLGFYKEAGVKAELTLYRGGAASQEALSAGAADIITYFGAGVALAISKGAKEKIVSAIDPTPHGWQFLVLANSPIKSIKDLDGKKIGVATKAGTADMFALWVADKAGVKVQTIPVGGGGMVPALRAGQVDAIAMFPGLSLQLVATGEARSLMDLGKEMEPTLPDVIVASQEMMDKRPQIVRGTLAAIYKAVGAPAQQPGVGAEYLKDFTEEKDDKVNVLTYEQVVVPLSQDGMVKTGVDLELRQHRGEGLGPRRTCARSSPKTSTPTHSCPVHRADVPAGSTVTGWLIRLGPLLLVAALAALWEAASRSGFADPRLSAAPVRGAAACSPGCCRTRASAAISASRSRRSPSRSPSSDRSGSRVGFFLGESLAAYRMFAPALHLLLSIPKSIFLPVFIFAVRHRLPAEGHLRRHARASSSSSQRDRGRAFGARRAGHWRRAPSAPRRRRSICGSICRRWSR